MNAELGAVVGPILNFKADAAGVIVSNVDGDQPGVVMNLFRWAKTIGYQQVLTGNAKGLQDLTTALPRRRRASLGSTSRE